MAATQMQIKLSRLLATNKKTIFKVFFFFIVELFRFRSTVLYKCVKIRIILKQGNTVSNNYHSIYLHRILAFFNLISFTLIKNAL